jgi:hypothetical protein
MAAPKAGNLPSVDEVLAGAGVDVEALKRRIADLLASFPNGIPQGILTDTIENFCSARAIYTKLGEVYVAAHKFAQTGKGPVGHASAEVA